MKDGATTGLHIPATQGAHSVMAPKSCTYSTFAASHTEAGIIPVQITTSVDYTAIGGAAGDTGGGRA
jgi:hypothetical protein